jgi:hypothetical protein
VREGDWEEAPFEGDGEETNALGIQAAERGEDSDEELDAERREWCGCENPGDVGWVDEDSTDLHWVGEYVWESSREGVCTRHLP